MRKKTYVLNRRAFELLAEAADLRQADVAERLGTTPAWISQLVTGRARAPEETVLRLAGILGTSPRSLMADEGRSKNHLRERAMSACSRLRISTALLTRFADGGKLSPHEVAEVAQLLGVDAQEVAAIRREQIHATPPREVCAPAYTAIAERMNCSPREIQEAYEEGWALEDAEQA